MCSTKLLALMLWVDDDPVTGNVINMEGIVAPRKSLTEYKVGEKVQAKCTGYGNQNGVIGRIGGESERKAMQAIMAGPEFPSLVSSLLVPDGNQDVPPTGGNQGTSTGGNHPGTSTQKRKQPEGTKTNKTKKKVKKLNVKQAADNLELLELELACSAQDAGSTQESTRAASTSGPSQSTSASDSETETHANTASESQSNSASESQANSASETQAISASTTQCASTPEPTSESQANSASETRAISASTTQCASTPQPTSKVVGDAFRRLNEVHHDVAPVPWERRVSILEQGLSQAFTIIDEQRNHISWLYQQQQQMSSSSSWSMSSLLSDSPPRQGHSSRNPTSPLSVSVNSPLSVSATSSISVSSPPAASNSSPLSRPIPQAASSPLAVPLSQAASSPLASGYTKAQLLEIIPSKATFSKASKLLFRKLYTEAEYVGRTLTGSRAGGKGANQKPKLENLERLNVLYEVIQDKWSYVTIPMINGKVAELLKPSTSRPPLQ